MYHPIPDSFGPGYRCQWMADMDCGLDYGYKSSLDSMGGSYMPGRYMLSCNLLKLSENSLKFLSLLWIKTVELQMYSK